MTCRLQPHPQTPCGVVDEVRVHIGVAASETIAVDYAIVGALDRLRIPAAGTALDPERLWAHTCCELFLAPALGDAYVEWNVSPTGQRARFAFASYRQRAPSTPIEIATPEVTATARELRLAVRVPLPNDLGETALRISPTVVIEDATGALSYWALRHPRDRPDFHHPDGFALALTLGPPLAIVQQ